MTARLLAPADGDLHQAVATGRFVEAVSDRPIEEYDAALEFSHAGASGVFPTMLVRRPGGWFALHLVPARDMPDLSTAGTVMLTLRMRRPGRPEALAVREVPGTGLAPVPEERTVAGYPMTLTTVPAAPVTFSVTVPPMPVQLDGIVLLDNDPSTPADGVTVTVSPEDPASPVGPVVTDPTGRFRVPALPVAEVVTLAFALDGGDDDTTECHVRPDYSRRVMHAVFTIPSS